MSDTTLTRADLAETVYQEIGLSRNESSNLVDTVLDMISAALIAGKNVKVSSFGSFILRKKDMRVGRNPKTREEVPIFPRTVLVFRPSQTLKQRVSGSKKATS